MNRNIQRSLLAIMIAMAFAAGPAMAERDPGQQSPATTQNRPAGSSYMSGTRTADTSTSSANQTAQEKFAALDVNSDGMIDQQEANASKVLSAEFKKLDTNNDGKLSLTEFSAAKNLASIKVDNVKKSGY